MANSEPMHVYPVPDGNSSTIPSADSSSTPVDAAAAGGTDGDTLSTPALSAGPDQPSI